MHRWMCVPNVIPSLPECATATPVHLDRHLRQHRLAPQARTPQVPAAHGDLRFRRQHWHFLFCTVVSVVFLADSVLICTTRLLNKYTRSHMSIYYKTKSERDYHILPLDPSDCQGNRVHIKTIKSMLMVKLGPKIGENGISKRAMRRWDSEFRLFSIDTGEGVYH